MPLCCVTSSGCDMLFSMTRPFTEIPVSVCRSLRLIMTDVDGTLTADGEHFCSDIVNMFDRLKKYGLIIGLVSGRTLPRLQKVTRLLGTDGPLIAENGGVAQLAIGKETINLGYSRQPAFEAVAKLKTVFPAKISEREDNIYRTVDVTIDTGGLSVAELRLVAPGVQILDSGYMVHIMAETISKGGTLQRMLDQVAIPSLNSNEVMVFGDSPTDISLFQYFSNSVRILNPQLSSEQQAIMTDQASYHSELAIDAGFMQVAEYIVRARKELIVVK